MFRIRVLTQRFCEQVENGLSPFNALFRMNSVTQAPMLSAIRYKEVLLRLKPATAGLEEILDSTVNSWRGWAVWNPNKRRLEDLAKSPSGSSLGALMGLEGPDLGSNGGNHESMWQALVRKGELLAWLESKGFDLGAGLITGDSEQLLMTFIHTLLDCAVVALREGSVELLEFLVGRDGLDLQTLRAWQAAVSLLQPHFIALLIQKSAQYRKGDVETVTEGLNALALETYLTQSGRVAFQIECGSCVQTASDKSADEFRMSFATGSEWKTYARQLWKLRRVVASSGWLHSTLDPAFVGVCGSQESERRLTSLFELQEDIKTNDDNRWESDLQNSIDAYIYSFVLNGTYNKDNAIGIPHVLHGIWTCNFQPTTRRPMLWIASLDILDPEHRIVCIRRLQITSGALPWQLLQSFVSLSQGKASGLMELTRIIERLTFGHTTSDLSDKVAWQSLVLSLIGHYGYCINHADFLSFGFTNYRLWIERLHDIVDSDLEQLVSTHMWLSRLSSVESTLRDIERLPDSDVAIQCILTSHQVPASDRCFKMLQCLHRQSNSERIKLMQELILSLKSSNSGPVSRAICAISKASAIGFLQCQNLLVACHEDRAVAAVRLAVWLRTTTFAPATETALYNLGHVLQLGLDKNLNPPETSVEPARKDYAKRVADMVVRAQQLEQTRMILRKKDPDGIKSMVSALGLEQASGVAVLMADLPHDLVSVIEQTADDKVELHFSLANDLTAMDRLAFGLTGTETLTVHLRLNDSEKLDSFCVHVEDSGELADVQDHTYFQSAFAPDHLYCTGRLSRLTYVVSRGLWRLLQQDASLKVLYDGVQTVMRTSASRCIVCAANIGAQLHRATVCSNSACHQAYLRSDLNLRLQDARTDGRVVDLLLTSVFATAAISNLNLLPDRPPRLSDASKLLVLLNSLPTTDALAAASDFKTGLQGCGQRAELLLSWLCTSYRGFIISATGNYRIPNLPGIHQFLLVNGPPEIEAAFAKHNHLQPRHVLFHGTSMDRLYPVLAQGLRVLSGTPLQKHGAVHGSGIYMAREPNTAMGYASVTQKSGNNYKAFFNSRSDFQNATILLGCEHAGNDTGSTRLGGVHVISDPTKVIVRYIFVVPSGVKPPRALDISTPMLSTFNSLRTTAAARSAIPAVETSAAQERVPGNHLPNFRRLIQPPANGFKSDYFNRHPSGYAY